MICRHCWPEIVRERREVSEACTAEGVPCSLIGVRHPDGRLGLYLDGRLRCSVILPPPVHTELVAALARLAD